MKTSIAVISDAVVLRSGIQPGARKHQTAGPDPTGVSPAFKRDQSFNAEGRRNAASQALSSFDALAFAQDHELVEWQRAAEKILNLGESSTPTKAMFFTTACPPSCPP